MAGEGGYLRRARQMHNLTLADVEEYTKIRRMYLQALEDEQYEELPGDAYIRGFLRSYARFLRLDPDEIIEMYSDNGPRNALVPVTSAPTKINVQSTRVLPVPLIILVVVTLLAVGVFGWFIIQKMGDTSTTLTYEDDNFQASAIQQQALPKTSIDPNAAISAAPLTAQFSTSGLCWFYIRSDGELVMYDLLNAGETRTVTANSKIEFVEIGAPSNVKVVFNDKDVNLFQYINKNGIILDLVLTSDS